jgi:hypothetical protein
MAVRQSSHLSGRCLFLVGVDFPLLAGSTKLFSSELSHGGYG